MENQINTEKDPAHSSPENQGPAHSNPANQGPAKHSLPFKIWRVIYPLLIFFGVQIAGGIVLVLVYAVTVIAPQVAQGVSMAALPPQQIMDWILGKSVLMALICDLVVLPLFIFLYLHQIKGQKQAVISSFKVMDYVLVAALAVAADFAVTYVLVGFNLISYFPDYENLMNGIGSSSLILQVIAVGIVAPAAEEFLMRGVILNRLLGYMRVLPAVLLQAVLFGVLHMNLLQGAYAAVLGLLMGFIYIKYGSLLMTILFHITLNTLSVLLPSNFAEGVNPFFILIPAVIVTAGLLWIIARREKSVMFFTDKKLAEVPQEEA